jgi:hypothetical protein
MKSFVMPFPFQWFFNSLERSQRWSCWSLRSFDVCRKSSHAANLRFRSEPSSCHVPAPPLRVSQPSQSEQLLALLVDELRNTRRNGRQNRKGPWRNGLLGIADDTNLRVHRPSMAVSQNLLILAHDRELIRSPRHISTYIFKRLGLGSCLRILVLH